MVIVWYGSPCCGGHTLYCFHVTDQLIAFLACIGWFAIDVSRAGGVFGVMVSPLDDTSVQVTWVPLASRDVAEYKVYFTRIGGDISSLERRQEGEEREGVVTAPANATSTRVEGLENGAEYQFQVVGVVIVNGLERDGERSNGSTAVVGGVTGESLGVELVPSFWTLSLSALSPSSLFSSPPTTLPRAPLLNPTFSPLPPLDHIRQ